jgi:putative Mg2+ transporter-C (MgtC) family protein
MEAIAAFFSPYLNADTTSSIVRIAVAVILGMLLGIDREFRRKPAGLRSHMLVSLAAALLTILTFKIADHADQLGEAVRTDPLRIMEAVVAGIAFLGAGAIIRERNKVRGVTTGASLWLAGALGVACGSGSYALAITGAVIGLFVLFVLGRMERAMAPAIDAVHEREPARDPAREE